MQDRLFLFTSIKQKIMLNRHSVPSFSVYVAGWGDAVSALKIGYERGGGAVVFSRWGVFGQKIQPLQLREHILNRIYKKASLSDPDLKLRLPWKQRQVRGR